MKPAGILTLLVTLLVACSSQVPSPPPTQIAGEWGGFDAQITDSVEASSLVLSLPCNGIIIRKPILVDSVGGFEVNGVILEASSGERLGDTVKVYGRVVQANLTLYAGGFLVDGPFPRLFTLSKNSPVNWGVDYCTV